MFLLHFCIKSTTVQRKDKYGGETVSDWRNVLEVSTVASCPHSHWLWFGFSLIIYMKVLVVSAINPL